MQLQITKFSIGLGLFSSYVKHHSEAHIMKKKDKKRKKKTCDDTKQYTKNSILSGEMM